MSLLVLALFAAAALAFVVALMYLDSHDERLRRQRLTPAAPDPTEPLAGA